MGYKCILLDVNIRDIRGDQGVEHGADWINRTYGSLMRQGRYGTAFTSTTQGDLSQAPDYHKRTTLSTFLVVCL